MPLVISPPPFAPKEPVTEYIHGVAVTDDYRWLEDQESPATRRWIREQQHYARTYLEALPNRQRIQKRVRELTDVESFDSFLKAGNRYFFRKRLKGQEQPSIYLREGPTGPDKLLIDPTERGTGHYTAVKPLQVSPDGRFLLYEVKQGGERSSACEILNIEERTVLPDTLPRGYLRGFIFVPNGSGFYYAHESINQRFPAHRAAAYFHTYGMAVEHDREIFSVSAEKRLRLCLIGDPVRIGFLVYRFLERRKTDFYVMPMGGESLPEPVLEAANFVFTPVLTCGKIFALTDRDAPNFRIVKIELDSDRQPEWIDVVPHTDARIVQWCANREQIVVGYAMGARVEFQFFDALGHKTGQLPVGEHETIRLLQCAPDSDEALFQRESFTEPLATFRFSPSLGQFELWTKRVVPFNPHDYGYTRVLFSSKDGTKVPMFVVGRKDLVASGSHPTIMTSYGGVGISSTPQFSVLVAFLLENGCLFALPGIRGGSEFGVDWHRAAKRRNRQRSFEDFLAAAEFLITSGRTGPNKLAIMGGSNSGLLVGASMTLRPALFRAALCMVPVLDMLRYHLFDQTHTWLDEFGTAEDPDDFLALRSYSPYHQVQDGTTYPAVMFVSGDVDRNCNPLHARKMTARLQAANPSGLPVILDYHELRGHSAVLPLTMRVEALTDRLAFLTEQLHIAI